MHHRSLSLALAVGLLGFGCSQPPATMIDVASPARESYRLQAVPGRVPISNVHASTQLGAPHHYYLAGNVGDGNLTSAWAPTATDTAPTLVVSLAKPARITDISIKVSMARNSRPSFHRVNVEVDAEGPNGTWVPIVSAWSPPETLLQLIGVAPRVTGKLRLRFSTTGAKLADLLVCEVVTTGEEVPYSPPYSPPSSPAASPSAPVPSYSPSTAPGHSPSPGGNHESPAPTPSPDQFAPVEYGPHPPIYAMPWSLPETLITPVGSPPAWPEDPTFCGRMAGESVFTGRVKRDGQTVSVPVHVSLVLNGNGEVASGTLRVAVNPAFDIANFVFNVTEAQMAGERVSLKGTSEDGLRVQAFVYGTSTQTEQIELWVLNTADQPIFRLTGVPDEGTAAIQACQ